MQVFNPRWRNFQREAEVKCRQLSNPWLTLEILVDISGCAFRKHPRNLKMSGKPIFPPMYHLSIVSTINCCRILLVKLLMDAKISGFLSPSRGPNVKVRVETYQFWLSSKKLWKTMIVQKHHRLPQYFLSYASWQGGNILRFRGLTV